MMVISRKLRDLFIGDLIRGNAGFQKDLIIQGMPHVSATTELLLSYFHQYTSCH